MICPHCQKNVSLFSKALMAPTKPGGSRPCPHCQQPFAITADPMKALLVVLVATVLGFFLLRPIPYVGSALWGAAVVFAAFLLAAKLKKA